MHTPNNIVMLIAAAMLASGEGLGFLIFTSRLYMATDLIFLGIQALCTVGLVCHYGIQAVFRLGFGRYQRAESTPLRGGSPVRCCLALVCRYGAGFAFAQPAIQCGLSLTIPLRPTFRSI